MSFATKIISLRTSAGMSQQNLSAETGISVTSISSWERGITTAGAQQLNRLADFFSVTTDYLLDRQPTDETEKDILAFQRAYKRADEEKRRKMMAILEIAFESDFGEE